jgi:branched-chain amino acid transport system ATP-binding protein
MAPPLLEVDSVRAGYGAVRVLEGLSLSVARQSITALVGSNGAGKTTLMRVLCGLLPIQAGRLVYDGVSIDALRPNARVELGISLVPEGRMIFPELSVEENLRAGALTPRARPRARQSLERMYALFPRLADRRRQVGQTLSGGEQQMLAIARALMAEPRLLLLDEPSLGLAPQVVSQVFDTIERIRNDGVTVLIVEQNVRRTLAVADYAYVIEHGALALAGEAASVAADPEVRRAYLGL